MEGTNNKLFSDLIMPFQSKTASKNCYVQLELFEDMITRFIFISWLAKRIRRQANRLFKLLRKEDKTWTPRNILQDIKYKNIYSCCQKHKISVESVGRR